MEKVIVFGQQAAWTAMLSILWKPFMLVYHKRRLTVSMGTPCDKSTVVAFVWRATW